MWASLTELVYCSVATRAKSAAKLLTRSSVCSLLSRGMLSFSSLTPGSSCGTAWPTFCDLLALQILLHLADERGVFFEQVAVLAADDVLDFFEVFLEVVENAAEAFFVFRSAVELGEHLVGIVDRRERLVGAGVGHAGPGVGAVGDHDAEFERAEAGAGLRGWLAGSF